MEEKTLNRGFLNAIFSLLRSLPPPLLTILVMAPLLAFYLLSGLLNPTDPLRTIDAKSYWYSAGTLVEEHQFRDIINTGTTPTTWRPPVTAIGLAGARFLGLQPSSILIVYWLFLLCTVFLLWASAREITSNRYLPLLPCLIYLIHPKTYELSQVIMSETPFMLLAVATFFLLLRGTRDRYHDSLSSYALIALAGLIFGLAFLTRTIIIAFLPGLIMLLIARKKKGAFPLPGIVRFFRYPLVFIFGIMVILVPWQVRNARVHDQFVLVNTAGAYNLYIGAVHNTNLLKDPKVRDYIYNLRASMPEAKVAQVLREKAVNYIRAHPSVVVKQSANKAVNFWLHRGRWGDFTSIVQLVLLAAGILALLQRQKRME
ncbi:glycosyltransferase family 39 protein, partial [Candidatus Pacearchaeota archaeon]|nr:glycosyltransferase family 39 protein [Candidatus Pacearchaeota archaeon]